MWIEITKFFEGAPAKLKVAKLMVELGFSINEKGRVVCGNVEIADVDLARAADTDRRVVRQTVEEIMNDQFMRKIFTGIKPAGSFLKDIAPTLGYGVVEIRAQSNAVGIISQATKYIADAGISIRQILAEDPELNPDPKLMIITEKKVPGEVISKILTIPTVTKVSLS
ncbi:MAG: amino acid-binding protein [Candidatus Verstraetearchaeota archaeon]|nr:amino acid-binding protein [Candidatus Verstraetearchaeota archaeon]